MKSITFIPFFLFTFSIYQAQNLVQNGSFETTKTCPGNVAFNFKKLKLGVKAIKGTPDYFNTCSTTTVGIPSNATGYQKAADGNAYCGIILTSQLRGECDLREYIQLQLKSPLKNGFKYKVSFWINLANLSGYYTDQIGMYISKEDFSKKKTIKSYLGKQQINNSLNHFLNDTTNWTKIEGIYNAKGGEEYLIIGNFQGCNKTSRKPLIPLDKEGVMTNLKNKYRGKIIKDMANGSKKIAEKTKKQALANQFLVELIDLAYYLIDDVSIEAVGKNKEVTYLTQEKACASSSSKNGNNLIKDSGFDFNKKEGASWKNASKATPDFVKEKTGIYLYSAANKNNREYIYANLKETLDPCFKYHFEMKVKRGGNYKYMVDQVGVCLIDTFVLGKDRMVFDLLPQYQSPKYNLINNTSGWMTLCGELVTENCSQFIIIGNFSTDNETYIYSSEINRSTAPFAYYFIDDVVLYRTNKIEGCINPCKNSILPTLKLDSIMEVFKNTFSVKYNTGEDLPEIINRKMVANFKALLSNNPSLKILIEGHTDNKGTVVENTNLSRNRAQKIYEYLIAEGIPKNNLSYKYYGSKNPLVNNNTVKNRALNRRVDITIIE